MTTNKPFYRALSGALFATGIFALLVAHAAVIADCVPIRDVNEQLWSVPQVVAVADCGHILVPLLIGIITIATAFAIWDD